MKGKDLDELEMELGGVWREVQEELFNATDKFPPMRSPHEGYAILREKVDELWKDIKTKRVEFPAIRNVRMRREAIQVATMAIRFVIDCCDTTSADRGTPK